MYPLNCSCISSITVKTVHCLQLLKRLSLVTVVQNNAFNFNTAECAVHMWHHFADWPERSFEPRGRIKSWDESFNKFRFYKKKKSIR